MNLQEYERVKSFEYLEYCDYLQKKYGKATCDYMTRSWNKNNKVSRTKEGLLAHHKFEDHAIMLSNKEYAMLNPYEWQLAENIVYCNYLEHLFLHILICEHPSPDRNEFEAVGIGGVINYIAPKLNDFYSGWEPSLEWEKRCLDVIKKDKNVYLELLRRFKTNCNQYPLYEEGCLVKSLNEAFGTWNAEKNKKIFKEINEL